MSRAIKIVAEYVAATSAVGLVIGVTFPAFAKSAINLSIDWAALLLPAGIILDVTAGTVGAFLAWRKWVRK